MGRPGASIFLEASFLLLPVLEDCLRFLTAIFRGDLRDFMGYLGIYKGHDANLLLLGGDWNMAGL